MPDNPVGKEVDAVIDEILDYVEATTRKEFNRPTFTIPNGIYSKKARAALEALIAREVRQARYDELKELNAQIAVNNWYDENAYKMYEYMLKRQVSLHAQAEGQ